MASRSSKRTRKRHTPRGAARGAAATGRRAREGRQSVAARESRVLAREGERPQSPFGGLPISELAILMGVIAVIFGYFRASGPTMIVGVIVCTLGVVEVTGREHFSGYRSHTTLLSGIPALAVTAALAAAFGAPRQRLLLVAVAAPVFAALFWVLRRRFLVARQARIARGGRGSVSRAPAG